MWRGRGPGAGWSDRRLGTAPLRLTLCVQADRNDIPDRRLGTAAESTVSGTVKGVMMSGVMMSGASANCAMVSDALSGALDH